MIMRQPIPNVTLVVAAFERSRDGVKLVEAPVNELEAVNLADVPIVLLPDNTLMVILPILYLAPQKDSIHPDLAPKEGLEV